MPAYRELLDQVKSEIEEIDSSTAAALLESGGEATFVDVRERDEWDEGHIPGAIHVPRGYLESRIENVIADRSRRIVVYCASGARSAFAAKTLEELGYDDPVSLAGGFTDWKRNGLPTQLPRGLAEEQRRRYSRHLLIPEVGEEGQLRLLDSRILLIGAGGLGSPASLYLAAAGVGTLGIVDDDAVDATNLQRQIVHSTERLGEPKAESAKRTIEALNPDVTVKTYRERLTSENVDRILGEGWDVIVDGADNFPTRYLLNDASVWHGIPVVHGSIFRFEGQITVFRPRGAGNAAGKGGGSRPSVEGAYGGVDGPCYRCLFPQPPPSELAPSCAEGGVLGVLPGVIGSIQANEALKLALGIGEPLVGRLLLFDALAATFTEVSLRRDPACPVCGDEPTITEYIDYVEFCQGTQRGRNRVSPASPVLLGGEL
jgi:sulfur-carrier protein adenylyltransferase/sulfurtransferase